MSETNVPNIANSLLLIHHVITRGLDVSARNSEAFAANGFPDEATKAGFLNYARSLESVLEGHHLAEDELAFPYLRDFVPDAPYDELSAGHRAMVPILVQIASAVAAAASSEDPSQALSDLHDHVVRVSEIWHPHIATEEQNFSAEDLGQLIAPDEHIRMIRALGEFSQQHTGPGPLVIPFILYNLPEPERTAMARGMPPAVTQELVPGPWRAQWSSMGPFLLD